jgi:hypothetical protein
MARNESSLLTESLLTALSPALIVGMVGSLVFFLAEVFYGGKYEERLLWTFFCFVGGIVLVARIAIVVDEGRASLYGLILAFVTYLALMAFIQFPPSSPAAPIRGVINAILIFVVWWTANKLTWDCTFLDDRKEISGQGLLAAAGFEEDPIVKEQRDQGRFTPDEEIPKPPKTFQARYKAWKKERANRPHTPGVTVIWFALAALPIFGLGQSLIPSTNADRRTFAFYCAAVYVSCSLALLMTVSYVGLRRYLYQRKLTMPTSMTATWLGFGTVMIVIFVGIATILPRPYSETPIVRFDALKNPDRKASKNAQMRGKEAGEGEGQSGEKSIKGDGKATSKNGDPKQAKGSGGDKQAGGKDGKAKNAADSKDQDGKQPSDSKNADTAKSKSENKQDSKDSGESKSSEPGNKAEENKSESKNSPPRDSLQEFQNSGLGKIAEKIGLVLKWLVFIAIALIALFFLFRGALGGLAKHFSWAFAWLESLNAWWANLFAKKADAATEEEEEETEQEEHVPFRAFLNPFSGNGGDSRPLPELIRYSYRSLESWAADAEDARRENETVLEFAARLSVRYPALGQETQRLANLVTRLAYAPGKLPTNARSLIEQYWDRITQLAPGQGQMPRRVTPGE